MSFPNDLVFAQVPGTGDVLFGDTGATANLCDVSVTLGGVTVAAFCAPTLYANITTTLAGVSVEAWANYAVQSTNPNDFVFSELPTGTNLEFGLADGGAINKVVVSVAASLGGVTVQSLVVGGLLVNVAVTLGGVTVKASCVPPRIVDVSATLGGVSVDLFATVPIHVDVTATLGGVTAHAQGFYDNRVTWWKDARSALSFQPATPVLKADYTDWQVGKLDAARHEIPWGWAESKEADMTAASELAVGQQQADQIGWELGVSHDASSACENQLAIPHTDDRGAVWGLTTQHQKIATEGMQAGIYKVYGEVAPWGGMTTALSKLLIAKARDGVKHTDVLDALWETAVGPRAGFHTVLPEHPIWWGTDLVFADGHNTGQLVFGDIGSDIPVVGPVTVPTQRVYMVSNDAALYRNGVLIPSFTMSLSLDVASWTWGFSASLPATALDSMQPASNGAPVEVEAHINGVIYTALIEGITRSRSFGKDALTVQGRGKLALLDAPYAPVMSFTSVADRTARQLLDDVLTVNGVSMGWTVTFGLDDWLVPGSTFSHQGSYISALNAIAKAAGGYVQPHPSLNALSVLPLYPYLPRDWAWADYTLPSALSVTEGIVWTEKPRYNRVYVSGVSRGVIGRVTEAGTAGELLAPMVTDPLITTVGAARQRGISVLGDTGRIATVSIKVPVLAATGVIPPGKMVKYTDNGVERLGIVRSVNVDVGLPEIWQTLGVETHVN